MLHKVSFILLALLTFSAVRSKACDGNIRAAVEVSRKSPYSGLPFFLFTNGFELADTTYTFDFAKEKWCQKTKTSKEAKCIDNNETTLPIYDASKRMLGAVILSNVRRDANLIEAIGGTTNGSNKITIRFRYSQSSTWLWTSTEAFAYAFNPSDPSDPVEKGSVEVAQDTETDGPAKSLLTSDQLKHPFKLDGGREVRITCSAGIESEKTEEGGVSVGAKIGFKILKHKKIFKKPES